MNLAEVHSVEELERCLRQHGTTIQELEAKLRACRGATGEETKFVPAAEAGDEPKSTKATSFATVDSQKSKVGDIGNTKVADFREKPPGDESKVLDFCNKEAERGARHKRSTELANSSAIDPGTPSLDVFGQPLPQPVRMGKMGRPPVMNEALAEQALLLVSVGFSRRQAAAYLGVSASTLVRWGSKSPDFTSALCRAKELASIQPELTMLAAVRKNWRAAAWYLTNKAKMAAALTKEERTDEEQEKHHKSRSAGEQRDYPRQRQRAKLNRQLRKQQVKRDPSEDAKKLAAEQQRSREDQRSMDAVYREQLNEMRRVRGLPTRMNYADFDNDPRLDPKYFENEEARQEARDFLKRMGY
jgi:hypothetical protein